MDLEEKSEARNGAPKVNSNFQRNIPVAGTANLAIALTIALMVSTEAVAAAKHSTRHAPAGGGASSGPAMPAVNPAMMSPLDHNNRGVQFGMRGMWPQAIAEAEAALNGDPENPQFRTNLSAAYLKYGEQLGSQKKYPPAISKFRQALYVDPNNAEAAARLDVCIKNSGGNPDAHQKMGDDLEVSANYPEAIAEYKRWVRAEDSGMAWAALARAEIKQGASSPTRLVDGFTDMRKAVSKPWEPSQAKEQSECHCQLANILKEYAFLAKDGGRTEVALKRLLNASTEYRRAVQINPLNTDAISGLTEICREAVAIKPSFDNHLMLGGAYLLRGDLDHAKQEYGECNKIDPGNEALNRARKAFQLAVVSSTQHTDMIPRAIQVAEDYLKRPGGSNDAEWLYIWGLGKQKQGDLDSASKAFTKAYTIMPGLPKIKENMAAVGIAIANPGGGAPPSAGGKAPDAKSGSAGSPPGSTSTTTAVPPVTAPVESPAEISKIGAIEGKARAGDLDGALKDCDDMLDKNQKSGKIWKLKGMIAEKKGNLDDASINYRMAADLGEPGAKELRDTIDASRAAKPMSEGDAMMAQQNWVGASSSYREALSLAPNLAVLHRKLADALDKLGDKKEAERERKKAAELEK